MLMCSYNYYFILVEAETSLHKDVKNRIKQIFFTQPQLPPVVPTCLFCLTTCISHLRHSTPIGRRTPTGRTDGPLPLLVIPSSIVRNPTFGAQTAKGEKQNSASSSNEVFVVRVLIRIVLDSQGFVRLDSPIV